MFLLVTLKANHQNDQNKCFGYFKSQTSKSPKQCEKMPHVSSHRNLSSPRNKQILFNGTKRTYCTKIEPFLAEGRTSKKGKFPEPWALYKGLGANAENVRYAVLINCIQTIPPSMVTRVSHKITFLSYDSATLHRAGYGPKYSPTKMSDHSEPFFEEATHF